MNQPNERLLAPQTAISATASKEALLKRSLYIAGLITACLSPACGDDEVVYCDTIGRDDTGFTCQCFDEDNDPIDGPVHYSYSKTGPKGCDEVAENWSNCGNDNCDNDNDDDDDCGPELCGDGKDNDCDGQVDEGCNPYPSSGSAFCAPQLAQLPGAPFDGSWFVNRAGEVRNCSMNTNCLNSMLNNTHPQFHCGWSIPGNNQTPGECAAYCALTYGSGSRVFNIDGGSMMTAGAVDGDESEMFSTSSAFPATLSPGPGAVCWSACEWTSINEGGYTPYSLKEEPEMDGNTIK